jgi:hypothetical protein
MVMPITMSVSATKSAATTATVERIEQGKQIALERIELVSHEPGRSSNCPSNIGKIICLADALPGN